MGKSFALTILAASCLYQGSTAIANIEQDFLVGTVQRVMTADDGFGGCMIRLDVSPDSKIASCAANWLTVDCTATIPGTVSTRSTNISRFQAAQLSYVTGYEVKVIFDTRGHNGFCYASRIDNLPPPS